MSTLDRLERTIAERRTAPPESSYVAKLNAKGVPAPRGDSWAVSALYGNPLKGAGVVNNQLYAGTYVWNRSQWIKDPDTGMWNTSLATAHPHRLRAAG